MLAATEGWPCCCAVDFTWQELSTLRVKQRFPATRDKSFDGEQLQQKKTVY